MSDVDKVFELAADEILFRLEDDERRAGIPDHVLIKFLEQVTKREEQKRKDAEQEQVAGGKETDVLDLIDNEQVTAARKRQLLRAEISRSKQRLKELEKAEEELT